MNENYLTYGQTISIHLPNEIDRYLFSEGFIKTNIQLKVLKK